MQLKHSVMIGFMGRQADRFHEYQPAHTLAERLDMAARVQGVDGIEPVYPNDFVDGQVSIDLIRDSGLPIRASRNGVKVRSPRPIRPSERMPSAP